MTSEDIHRRISELQGENLPPLTWSDLFVEKPDAPLTEADRATLNEYFQRFVATPKNQNGQGICLCCRSVMRSGLEGVLLGGAPGSTTLEWDVVHGEAFCHVCHWPFRVYHYDIGGKGPEALIAFLNVALAVHPSLIESRESQFGAA